MTGKLASETTKKLLLNNILLVLAYLVFQTVGNFAANEYIMIPTYAEAALQLIAIVLYALCIAAIVLSLYKTFVVDLSSGKSYKYYSLPYKKSKIIFARAVPAIIIESVMVAILFGPEADYDLLCLFEKTSQGIVIRYDYLPSILVENTVRFTGLFILAVTIGFLILLAFVISRSFDPSKTVRNLVIAVIIEVLANGALYMIIENISSEFAMKYAYEAQKYPAWTAGEISKAVGLLAYYGIIIQAVVLLLLIIEMTCAVITSKKLADKRFNVL